MFEKEGRFEICGGMWVEPDTNLPSGESLVRQRLYGQRFYLKHFGKISKVEFLPDTFGFSANLPQILLKSGAKYFYTSKITWNDFSEFPLSNFYWQGIDGSKIFTHCFYYYIYAIMNLGKCKRLARKPIKKGVSFNSNSTYEYIESKLHDDYVKTCSLFYGFSDGGMGPFEEEIGLIANMARMGLLKITNVENFFRILKKECGELIPIWDDELYLEFHRGCYTSQAKIKKLNRLCEINIRNLELLASILYLFSDKYNYPQEEIEQIWKTILFNQFHDILPGSSIQDVYYEQEKELENILKKTKDLIKDCLVKFATLILKNMEIREKDSLVFNSLNWNRAGVVKIENKIVTKEINTDIVSPLSFKLISIKDSLNRNRDIPSPDLKYLIKENKVILENTKLELVFDKKNGEIDSIKLKDGDRKEFIKPRKGVKFIVYKNKPPKQYAAWNIDLRYPQNIIPLTVENVEILEKPNKITIKVLYSFKKSKIRQHISLKPKSDNLLFRTEMDVKDKNILIKILFPFDLDTNSTFSEIPYGVKERKIKPQTEFQKGKWEFPAQKWITMSDDDYGINLVNDCKYGFSTNRHGLSMSLLVTTHYPIGFYFSYIKTVPKSLRKNHIDLGKHTMKYAIKFYKGNWQAGEPWKYGYEFNYPIISLPIKKFENRISNEQEREERFSENLSSFLSNNSGFLEATESNIILQAMKKSEPNVFYKHKTNMDHFKSFILRFYETAGLETKCKFKFLPFISIKKIRETDLLEIAKTNQNIEIEPENAFYLNFTPFEIKTIKVWLDLVSH
jgi:alpha-mannosidase